MAKIEYHARDCKIVLNRRLSGARMMPMQMLRHTGLEPLSIHAYRAAASTCADVPLRIFGRCPRLGFAASEA